MKEGTLLFNKDTGEPVLVLIGYTDVEILEYIKGRAEMGTGRFGMFNVKCMEKKEEK